MKLNVFAAILTVMFATSAQAERVIVIMKDKASFKTVNQVYKVQGSYSLKGFKLGASSAGLTQVDGRVEDSLEHLNTLIIDTKSESEISKLQANPAVAYVEREIFHEAPRPVAGKIFAAKVTSEAAGDSGQGEPWGIAAVKAHQAWGMSNEGLGARVLVLDTGIDKDHLSLKDNFEKGQDFTGDSAGDDFSDIVGHGTHVAGTIAGAKDASGFTGVAPRAKILAGRVCAPAGCSNISIAQGINWGIEEKVDVISMSLGGMRSTPAEREAILRADQAGITVVAASGNSGTPMVSFPAALPTVISVGAVDSKLEKAEFSQWGRELSVVAPGVDVMSSVPTGTGRAAMIEVVFDNNSMKFTAQPVEGAKDLSVAEVGDVVFAGLGKTTDFAAVDVKGKIALISRGELSFLEKVQNAVTAGASAVLIYNNEPGMISATLGENSNIHIGVFTMEQASGLVMVAALQKGSAVMASMEVKATSYSSFQGTSMATPHVSGVVALMKAVNPSLTGAQVKEILIRTATPLTGDNSQNQWGAGMVNAELAVAEAVKVH